MTRTHAKWCDERAVALHTSNQTRNATNAMNNFTPPHLNKASSDTYLLLLLLLLLVILLLRLYTTLPLALVVHPFALLLRTQIHVCILARTHHSEYCDFFKLVQIIVICFWMKCAAHRHGNCILRYTCLEMWMTIFVRAENKPSTSAACKHRNEREHNEKRAERRIEENQQHLPSSLIFIWIFEASTCTYPPQSEITTECFNLIRTSTTKQWIKIERKKSRRK